MIYLDSCALVKLIVTETETAALQHHLDVNRALLVTSDLSLTEVVRVVRRSCHDAQRNLVVAPEVLDERLSAAGQLLDRVDRLVVDTDTFVQAGMYSEDPHLGSLDAIHLACAMELGAELRSFVTYDKRLAQSVELAGLPLEQPR